ncbi:glycosyltransferase [Sphingobacterium bovistauri]|uniref:Glycosyltransferase n=1 Tax=Sphingobacterium bovistauri TaxID=2781959 RepID=A0ABS7Z1R9_9SPHI|nr:glycosyltransferase [Sphingobacterium bovistauri]MCA5004125.1 glycosyltransferase [Sphingobacterium bovistauri]
MKKKTIVISAVNLIEAGTLAILRDCLAYLSDLAANDDYKIVAIVHKKDLANFPHIEYIETQWPKKRWINRLWYEYVSMKRISKQIAPVYLWFSLHDTSPSVFAERRAVYCHNSYSFYKWNLHDLIFAPKIALFAIFTKFIYKTNINKNTYLVVQQEWFRKAMSKIYAIKKDKIIVAIPRKISFDNLLPKNQFELFTFVFAGSPNSHKNFEVICRAAEILEKESSLNFRACITVSGEENKYAKWLLKKWGHLKSLDFIGFQSKDNLQNYYERSHCLIFPSKVESWGLPISEYANYNKPMLLADLPYAHETAAGAQLVSYFNPESANELALKMKKLIDGDRSFLVAQSLISYEEPSAESWKELFNILLTDKKDENSTAR